MVKALLSSDVMKAGTKVANGTSLTSWVGGFFAMCMKLDISSCLVCFTMKSRTGFSATATVEAGRRYGLPLAGTMRGHVICCQLRNQEAITSAMCET